MDCSNIFTYNPLAPDFLNGLDPGTPAGFEDTWAEHAAEITIAVGGSIVRTSLLFPWPFLIRAVYATLDFNGFAGPQAAYNVRIIDVDGEELLETRARPECLFGVGQAPMPWVPEVYVPQGQSLQFEVQDETFNPNQIVQIVFVGVRRRKLAGVSA